MKNNNHGRRKSDTLSRPFIALWQAVIAAIKRIVAAIRAAAKTVAAVPMNIRQRVLWLLLIGLAGLAANLIGKQLFSAPGCPSLRDFLLDACAIGFIVGAAGLAMTTPLVRVGIELQIVTLALPLAGPLVVNAVAYPVGASLPGVASLYCPPPPSTPSPCDQWKGEAQKLLNEAERQLREGKADRALELLNTAETQYAKPAVAEPCPEAKCLLARILNTQGECLFKGKDCIHAREVLTEALGSAKEGQCRTELIGQVEERITHYAKECVALSATPLYVPLGASATLKWNTEGASRVTLDGQTVEIQGAKVVTPTQTTKYTLRVVFLDGSVKDLPATVIVYSFSVTPQVIPSGGTATLTWSAEGASKVTLDEEPVAVQGSKTVTLTRTTTHALRIVFPDNSTQDLTSSVMVYSFSVSPKYIRRGESATLQWNAEGASKVTLDSQEMAVRGSRVVTPTQTTKYPLRVVFPGGSTRDLSATVTVVSCSFMATPQFIGTNESSRLEWNCPEASERTLDGQKVTAQGARVVAPTQTTAYTFRATFPDGSTKDLETAVTVGQGPCEPLRYDALGYKHVTPTLLQTEITATPSIRIPNEFAHPDNTVILQGDEIICLASTPDGTGELKVDDQIHFSVMPSNKNWVHDFYDPVTKGIKFYPAQNVTWTFAKGENRLKLILTDKIQGYYSTTNIWLIVWSRQ